MKEHEKVTLQKMRNYAKQAIEFKGNMNFEEFSNDAKTVAACVLNLSQIGEMVGRFDDEFTNKFDEIPWRKIKGMRNRIIHDYEGVKLSMVWDVLIDFLPELIENIDKIK